MKLSKIYKNPSNNNVKKISDFSKSNDSRFSSDK